MVSIMFSSTKPGQAAQLGTRAYTVSLALAIYANYLPPNTRQRQSPVSNKFDDYNHYFIITDIQLELRHYFVVEMGKL
jgi:hypothetical protein